MAKAQRFYVTTPIYYVNGRPHIGHAYTTIIADSLTRWKRICGHDAYLLTGTDEHGQKVLEKARERGMSAQAHVDDMVGIWRAMNDKLDVRPDHFMRTTEARHVHAVQAVLDAMSTKIDASGRPLLFKQTYTGWYSKSAERFWTEKDLINGMCPDTGQPVEKVEETNWFFRMSSFQDALITHIEQNPDFIRPASRRNEVLGFLRKELGDLCITRPAARMAWGIPLPFDTDYVTYVWFDALLNYLSLTGWTPETPSTPDFEALWPPDVQFMGKDILTTHAVYWSTMLLALDLPLPRTLFAHGWWMAADGRKMSKSLGNVVDVDDIVATFGLDAFRFYLLRDVILGNDGAFSAQSMLHRVNADLSNDLGNLAHRTLTMTEKWLSPHIPAFGESTGFEPALRQLALTCTQQFAQAMDDLRPQDALEAVMTLARAGNKYLDDAKPWTLHKEGDHGKTGTVLRHALEIAHLCATLLLPVLTRKSPELLEKLGTTAEQATLALRGLLSGRSTPLQALVTEAPIASGEPLFPRITELPAALQPTPEPEPEPVQALSPPLKATITYDDFAKVDLRAGVVLTAKPHPNADRLLVLSVDVGEAAPRSIVAGIADKYKPEELVGQKVIVVANLATAKLRGVPSQGMLLAAGEKAVVGLASVLAPPGTLLR